MGGRTYVEVEVSIDEFDDDVILDAARDIGFSPMDSSRVDDLVHAILREDRHAAIERLRDLLSDDRAALHRVDIASTQKVFA